MIDKCKALRVSSWRYNDCRGEPGVWAHVVIRISSRGFFHNNNSSFSGTVCGSVIIIIVIVLHFIAQLTIPAWGGRTFEAP